MENKKWVNTLIITDQERLESRVARIVRFLSENYEQGKWRISDLDPTGSAGGRLTLLLNDRDSVQLTTPELLSILEEEGQVIELDCTLVIDDKASFRIIVRDGSSVDLLGVGDPITFEVLGDSIAVDPSLFDW